MPIVRYIVWVGTSLLALLFVANWFLPESLREPTPEASNRPVIRIASIQQPPERIDIDTSQPTIVPPPMLFGEAVPDQPSPLLESYASVSRLRQQSTLRWRVATRDNSPADQIIFRGYHFWAPSQKPIPPRLTRASLDAISKADAAMSRSVRFTYR
jgi:hypothetical protein